MQYIFSLLPALACPVGMGLMMWFMMRGGKDSTPREANQIPMETSSRPQEVPNAPPVPHDSPQGTSLFKMLFMCLNWKVVAGLAVVGVLVWFLAPQFVLGAIPLLILAACPLSMLFMMRGMQGGGDKTASLSVRTSESHAFELTRDEQLAEMRSRLSGLQEEQAYLARQVAEMESPEAPVVSEAESVAQAATKRSTSRW